MSKQNIEQQVIDYITENFSADDYDIEGIVHRDSLELRALGREGRIGGILAALESGTVENNWGAVYTVAME